MPSGAMAHTTVLSPLPPHQPHHLLEPPLHPPLLLLPPQPLQVDRKHFPPSLSKRNASCRMRRAPLYPTGMDACRSESSCLQVSWRAGAILTPLW
ncbi:hypothetical protein PTTG_12603 [Puccinia triticina 1-1 BBBD Race 1]|uniref:Uncharacterized protein n=1 Tax=Puccinia triticina (isolate 1-1 / race 1 (BBBD)) TaxID=630390 RepID=A0A180G570_PUCT1|nr:hypothetical protein PTTG_12603 [Puccinia triticina 1-1 BBBD Race 1]